MGEVEDIDGDLLLCSEDEEMDNGDEDATQPGDANRENAAEARAAAAPARQKRKGASGAAVTEKDYAAQTGLDEAQARLLKAIGMQGKDQLRPVKQAVNTVNKKVDTLAKKQASDKAELEKRMNTMELELKRGPGSGGSVASTPSTRVDSMLSAARLLTDANFVPVKKRKIGIVGGFTYNETAEMVNFIKAELDRDALEYDKVVGSGSFGALVKIIFKTSDDMWKWLVKRKGKKYVSELADMDRPISAGDPNKRNLWHGIDKYDWEIAASRKSWKAIEEVAKVLTEKHAVDAVTAKSCVESNDYADVIFKSRNWSGAKNQYPVKLFELDRSSKELRIVVGCKAKMQVVGIDLDVDGILAAANAAGIRR